MTILPKLAVMPTKLKYKLFASFCLMSLMPILVGIYIASILLRSPLELATLISVTLVILFALTLSFLGLQVTKQFTHPIENAASIAKNIAEGKIETPLQDFAGSEELEELSHSLRLITHNAKELLDKVDSLSLKDKLTGLYNANYIRERLEEEIQRAFHYQNPCSFAYFSVINYDAALAFYGQARMEETLKSMADILNKHLGKLDRAARLTNGDFAVIYPSKNKKASIEITERICQEIMSQPYAKKDAGGGCSIVVCAGISENPLDGASADVLFMKAQNRMKGLKSKQTGGIEAFI